MNFIAYHRKDRLMEQIDVIIITFRAAGGAELFYQNMQELQNDEKIEILDAALVSKDAMNNLSVTETQEIEGGQGALAGAVVGGLLGLLGGPVGGIIGIVAGATTGGFTAEEFDFGIPEEMVEDFEKALVPESSALLTLLDHSDAETIKTLLGTVPLFEDARVFQHPVSSEVVNKIEKAKRKEKNDDK
jgi:uncharacterized membrane protein